MFHMNKNQKGRKRKKIINIAFNSFSLFNSETLDNNRKN